MSKTHFALLMTPLLWTTGGCGSSSSGPGGNPVDSGSSRDTGHPILDASTHDARDGGAPMGDAAAPSCATKPVCTGSAGAGQSCVGTVDALLVDPSGTPAAGVIVTVCGTDLCSLPVKSDTSGNVHLAVCVFMDSPSFRVLDDPTWVPFAVRLADESVLNLGKVTLTPLPAAGMAFPSASKSGTVSSNGVTLQVAAGSVTFDGEHQALGPNVREFRAAEVGTLPPGLSGGPVTAAWGLAPENTLLAPGATLTVPNSKGWSALAEVTFYLDGTDEGTTAVAPWGQWGMAGVGAVSADGSTVTLTAASGGLEEIGLIGLALK